METKNEIKEVYCSREISKLLKEKGFKVPVQSCYDGSDCVASYGKIFQMMNYNVGGGTTTSRPTHALAAQWIRENLNWHIELIWDIKRAEQVWFCAVSQIGDSQNRGVDLTPKNSPEEAFEDAIKYTLTNPAPENTSDNKENYEVIKQTALEEGGWEIVCESPLEIQHKDGDRASGLAARYCIDGIVSDFVNQF